MNPGLGTYGLDVNRIRPGGGARGPGLASEGMQQERSGTAMLGAAADEEQRRNIANQKLADQDKQGKAMLGSTLGSAGVGIAGSMAASSAGAAAGAAATSAALAGGATAAAGTAAGVAASAEAGAAAGAFGGPIGMAIGGILGALVVSKLF